MEHSKHPVRRCAVYTRKSSEEGLEQDFNSLHAQRDACEAFIRSQAGEGWRLNTVPPIHRPLRLDAAILSRMRSPVTSRSNWANDSSTLSVNRPIEVVVLNCWVTATNDTPLPSKISTILAKSASERVSRSTLYTTTTSTSPLL